MDMDQNQGPSTYIPAENIPHHHRHYVHHIDAPTGKRTIDFTINNIWIFQTSLSVL